MPTFRRVEDNRAGPSALGILVPPGQRTLVILRPRALEWDLLPVRPDQGVGSAFCDFARDDAATLARKVQRALEQGAAGGTSKATVVANSAGAGFLAGIPVSGFMWIVCQRAPGRPYQPLIFSSRNDAQIAVDRVTPILCPQADANQEYYFNTQNFAGTPLTPRSPEARG